MLLANFQNVSKTYGAQTVLRGISFQIDSGQKLGLIGPNGAGKTTILRILTGQEEPSDGNAATPRGVRIGYVPQHVEFGDDLTVSECILREHTRLGEALREQELRLSEAGEDEMDAAMRSYQRALDAFERIGGHGFPQKAEAMLDALGLAGRAEQKMGSLSGGEKNVLGMAEALLAEPDLLLLDEPANHLDYEGVAWLEDFLVRFRGAVLIVSHNRYLLDRVVQGILHLEGGRLQAYEGNYSTYRANRLRQLVAQQQDYIANQKRLAQLEKLVQRFANIARVQSDRAWGKRLHAREKQLEREKAQAVEKPTLGPSGIKPDFRTEGSRADIALRVRGYSKAFGERQLFKDAEMSIACGERVALLGPNGCGKTTLLRDIVERGGWENPIVRIGPSLTIGYCAQQQEVLKTRGTVADEIMSLGADRRDAHGILARFLFGQDDLNKRVSDLSGGERNRLQLARLMVDRPNFLILDEPTNHLDILAREAVEEALGDYEGTLLVVSHDRYFLDKVVERVVEVRDGTLHSYAGGFSEFWDARRRTMARVVGRVATRGKARVRSGRGLLRAAADLERQITEAEQQKGQFEQRIENAFRSGNRREARRVAKELEQLQKRLDELYEDWMAQSE